MKAKIILLLLAVTVASLLTSCEANKHLSVTVIDAITKKPIDSVYVRVTAGKNGDFTKSGCEGYTNGAGLFDAYMMIGCSFGCYDIIMEYNKAGYEVRKDFNVTEGTIELTPQSEISREMDSIVFWDVRINKKIPLKLPEEELIKKLGRPDSSIVEHGWDCGNPLNDLDSVTVYYYGKSQFIVSNDTALLYHLFFSDHRFTFGTSSFNISEEITEAEVQKLFPTSYNNMLYDIKNFANYGARRLKVGMITIPREESASFIFYFENGKLIEIELWWLLC